MVFFALTSLCSSGSTFASEFVCWSLLEPIVCICYSEFGVFRNAPNATKYELQESGDKINMRARPIPNLQGSVSLVQTRSA